MSNIKCNSIHLASIEIAEIPNADELIIKDEEIKIVYDYPLSVPVIKQFRHKGGFTYIELLRAIAKGYTEMYAYAESNKPYHAWDSLYLEGIIYDNDGKTVIIDIKRLEAVNAF